MYEYNIGIWTEKIIIILSWDITLFGVGVLLNQPHWKTHQCRIPLLK